MRSSNEAAKGSLAGAEAEAGEPKSCEEPEAKCGTRGLHFRAKHVVGAKLLGRRLRHVIFVTNTRWAPNCWGEDSAKQQRARRHRKCAKHQSKRALKRVENAHGGESPLTPRVIYIYRRGQAVICS